MEVVAKKDFDPYRDDPSVTTGKVLADTLLGLGNKYKSLGAPLKFARGASMVLDAPQWFCIEEAPA